MKYPLFLVPLAAVILSSPSLGQRLAPASSIKLGLRPVSYNVPMGQAVLTQFSLSNMTDESITLTVPRTQPAIPSPDSGLPISHVFSGGTVSGLSIATDAGRSWDEPAGYRAPEEAPILMIAPYSSVGVTIDLRARFAVLRGAGRYRVTWRPYAGAFGEESVVIHVGQLKRVEIMTDDGLMIVRLLYADAPLHVANFLELVDTGFYNGKVFHRVAQGYLIQGGCPRGDGTGIRPDGKRIPAEFNGHPMQKGTLAMALLEDDPDSGSCQFFICNTRHKDWDGRYTIFGELVGEDSFATLDRLMNTPADDTGRPLHPLYMRTVRIVDAPPDEVP